MDLAIRMRNIPREATQSTERVDCTRDADARAAAPADYFCVSSSRENNSKNDSKLSRRMWAIFS